MPEQARRQLHIRMDDDRIAQRYRRCWRAHARQPATETRDQPAAQNSDTVRQLLGQLPAPQASFARAATAIMVSDHARCVRH